VIFVTRLKPQRVNFMPDFVSNSAMSQSPRIEERLTDLEVKASFTEDQLEQLDAVVVRQQAQIDLLLREVAALKEQRPSNDAQSMPRNFRDDLPPHF
jgi:SlyX protein